MAKVAKKKAFETVARAPESGVWKVPKEESEKALMLRIRAELAVRHEVNVWRNNTGRIGEVRFGLGVGSADLVGLMKGGRFIALEVKRPKHGRVSEDQEKWIRTVRQWGGVAEVVTSPEEALDVVARAKAGRI